MATSRSARPARGHAWGTIRVRTSLYIRARPTRLAALYLDYEGWPRLFPATIPGLPNQRFVGERRQVTQSYTEVH